MNTRTGRALAGLAVIVAAIVLFVVLRGGDGDGGGGTTTIQVEGKGSGSADGGAERVPTIVVRNGEPVGGVRELSYAEGDQIRFRVFSDVADEVHVHGYDLAKDVEAGGSVSFDFPATIEGVFEAELEDRREQILELRVEP
jgi:hypothetical protein